MSADRPILILSASAGAGHMTAAAALRDELRARRPDLTTVVHDVLTTTSTVFRMIYARGYIGLVNHAPAAMGWLYDAMDRPGGRFQRGLRSLFQNVNAYPTMRYLIGMRPRLIVNTHFLPAEIVAGMRRTRRLACPQATVTTDFETHRIWVQPPTDLYFTATQDGKAYLEQWGVPRGRIRVHGIPVRRPFETAPAREQVRARYGFAPDRPLVLLMCGGFGVGAADALLAALLETDASVQILAVTGRNESLRRRLAAVAAQSRRRVWTIGYTRRVHEWMSAADLLVTKPGGLTASEALCCGLPMVIVSPIPGQETRNSDYLLESGAAIKVNSVRMLGYRVQRLLDEPRRLALLRQSALRLVSPGAAARIADDLLTLV